jgi:hypothetical protein
VQRLSSMAIRSGLIAGGLCLMINFPIRASSEPTQQVSSTAWWEEFATCVRDTVSGGETLRAAVDTCGASVRWWDGEARQSEPSGREELQERRK